MKASLSNIPTFPRPGNKISVEEVKQKYGLETVHRLHANETPLGPSPHVIEAVNRVALELGAYPPMSDISLREAIAEALGRDLTPEHIYTGCSGYETLELIARAFLEPGDEAIVTPPTFGVFTKITRLAMANVVEVPLERPDFSMNIQAMLDAVTDKTRLIFFCNPNNPTGTMATADQMDTLLDALPERVIVVADEVYHDFVTRPGYPNSIQHVHNNRPVIIIHSLAKSYGLPGLRLGYGIAPPVLANHIGGLHRGFHQNRLTLAAGIAAMQDQAHRQKVVSTVLSAKQAFYAQLDQHNIRYWPSETNFVLLESSVPAKQAVAHLQSLGVLVRAYGNISSRAIRVTIGTPEANTLVVQGLSQLAS